MMNSADVQRSTSQGSNQSQTLLESSLIPEQNLHIEFYQRDVPDGMRMSLVEETDIAAVILSPEEERDLLQSLSSVNHMI